MIKDLPEHQIRALEVGRGEFGEVMLALSEVKDGRAVTVPARQMSDDMPRMIAIITALLAGGGGVAIESTGSAVPSLTLVLEELENGLYPTQAARVLDLVKSSAAGQGFQVLLTTHSPALLNALNDDDHPGVLVIGRDRGERPHPGDAARRPSGLSGDDGVRPTGRPRDRRSSSGTRGRGPRGHIGTRSPARYRLMAGVLCKALTTTTPLVEFATTRVGSGDASLLLEMKRYRGKVPSATPISLWTLDEMLGSFG